jgi:type IV fimbrial biogenesis protein FimT
MLVSPRRRPPPGFTLIETMVVVTLLAIVGTIAAPSFRSFIGTMNAKSAAFDLISDLGVARSEAIKGNQVTTLAPVGGDWSKGWQITDAGGRTLRQREALPSSLGVGGAPMAGVSFRPNGRLSNDTVTANLSFSISSSIAGVTPRCVVITPTGAARSKMGSCS